MRRLLGVVVPLLVVVGCGSTTESSSTTVPESTAVTTTVPESTAPVTTVPVTTVPTTLPPSDEPAVALYLVRGETLTVVGRSIGTWDITAVVQALLAGPTDVESADGVSTQIPAATELLAASVEGNVATVDMTAAFESGGGSLSMTLRVAEVVYTVTQLPDVDVVHFRIDGEPRDMIGGEGIVVADADRASFQDGVLPPILLEQPFDRSALTNPIVIGGMTNAFEATVNYRVLAMDGSVIVEGMTMALCGTGCWGGFTSEIALPSGTTGPVTLQVFDYSEEDGTTMLDLVEITLT